MSNSASGQASDGRVMSGQEDITNAKASSEVEATNKGTTTLNFSSLTFVKKPVADGIT